MKIGVFVLFFLVPIVNAASILIEVDDTIIEGDNVQATVTITSNEPFDGGVDFTYSNIISGISSISFTESSFNGGEYIFSWIVEGLDEGEYMINGILKNSSGSILDTNTKNGLVESSAPNIVDSGPSGIVGDDSVTLFVETNEDSTCRYGTSNQTYSNMGNSFSLTGETEHEQILDELGEGLHKYYVACEDEEGYRMEKTKLISFTIDLPPTARIELSDESPLKIGTIEVRVITSEDLDEAPSLQYSFDDAPTTKKQISLSGANKNWYGYVIIEDKDDNRVGAFHFSGVDSSGNIGKKITDGNIFIVDSKKAPAPTSLKSTVLSDGVVKLRWYYEGEEIEGFKIFRSTEKGAGYVDYYDDSDDNGTYLDKGTVHKVTYYYKVAAVDNAGNIGVLSEEIYATSVDKYAVEVVEDEKVEEKEKVVEEIKDGPPKVLPPDLMPILETTIKFVDKNIMDVKDALNRVRERETSDELIKTLGIGDNLQSTLTDLEKKRTTLEGYKEEYSTNEDLEKKLAKIEEEVETLIEKSPRDASTIEQADFIQSISKDDIEDAINHMLNGLTITEKEKKEYLKLNDKKKSKIIVNVNAKIISIENMDVLDYYNI